MLCPADSGRLGGYDTTSMARSAAGHRSILLTFPENCRRRLGCELSNIAQQNVETWISIGFGDGLSSRSRSESDHDIYRAWLRRHRCDPRYHRLPRPWRHLRPPGDRHRFRPEDGERLAEVRYPARRQIARRE